MTKRMIAFILIFVICILSVGCERRSSNNSHKAQVDATDRKNEEKLVNDVFNCIRYSGDFREISNYFDRNITIAGYLINRSNADSCVNNDFDYFYSIACDLDKGYDYINDKYPDFLKQVFEDENEEALRSKFDILYEAATSNFDTLSDHITELHRIYTDGRFVWSSISDGSFYNQGEKTYYFNIKHYEVPIEISKGDGFYSVLFYYIKIDGKYYGLYFDELEMFAVQ